jgi:heme-degrading monooxygenase HmoA
LSSGRTAYLFLVRARVADGRQDEFLQRYAALAERVEQGLDGHVVHRLCRDLDDPAAWVIESEWESLEAEEAWEATDDHRGLLGAMRACWTDVQRSRCAVEIETRRPVH